MDAEFITYHNTANDASAENEAKYCKNNDSSTSFHFAVDDKEVRQLVPTDRNAWHCGDGANGKGNRKSIGVEVCYSKSGGVRFKNAEKLAHKFIAQLLHERGWGVDRVKQHFVWSGKNCPHRVRAEGRWNEIIAEIQKELDALKGKKATTASKPAPTVIKGYLDKGDKGESVKLVQSKLSKLGYAITVDGNFGDDTDNDVRDFQKKNGLSVDGIVGADTSTMLDKKIAEKDAKAKADALAKAEAKRKADEAKRKAEAKKREEEAEKAELPSSQYGTLVVKATKLNVRAEANFNAKVVKVVSKGEKFKVYGVKNGLYSIGAGLYCSAGTDYVTFTKNPNYGVKPQLLEVLASELWVYSKADWDAKDFTVDKGEVFTIARSVVVDGSKMYQLKSGAFITANPKYVKVQ